jgi:hypothetical protein
VMLWAIVTGSVSLRISAGLHWVRHCPRANASAAPKHSRQIWTTHRVSLSTTSTFCVVDGPVLLPPWQVVLIVGLVVTQAPVLAAHRMVMLPPLAPLPPPPPEKPGKHVRAADPWTIAVAHVRPFASDPPPPPPPPPTAAVLHPSVWQRLPPPYTLQ